MTSLPDLDDLQLLPPVLRLVARAGGLEAAARLVQMRGGVRVYVPERADPAHELVEIVTLPGLEALVDYSPADYITVPMARAALMHIRNQRLLAERQDSSIRDLSLRHRLTRRRVQQIVAEGCGQVDDLFS
jgi:hypothetical protein